jgi:uncharacterized membrane protein
MTTRQDQRLEIAMGQMLRIGVSVAATVVLAGGILYFWQFRDAVSNYQHFHAAPAASRNIAAIIAGVRRFDGRSLIALGILLLIATPVCRVIFGVVGFALQRDRIYTIISVIVLVILLMSFFARR